MKAFTTIWSNTYGVSMTIAGMREFLTTLAVLGLASSVNAQSWDGLYRTPHKLNSCYGTGHSSNDIANGVTYCRQDGSGLTYYTQLSASALSTSIAIFMQVHLDATDLAVTATSSPVYSATGTGETDIIFAVSDQIPGAGIAICDDSVDSERCDQHYVMFKSYLANDPARDEIICHEVGHAVGLTHGGLFRETGGRNGVALVA